MIANFRHLSIHHWRDYACQTKYAGCPQIFGRSRKLLNRLSGLFKDEMEKSFADDFALFHLASLSGDPEDAVLNEYDGGKHWVTV